MSIKLTKQGLAVDLDDTLSDTMNHWVKQMQQKFGNPENLSVKELAKKYKYVQNVPYWQTDSAIEWANEQIHSSNLHAELPLIEGAKDYLIQINKIIPISIYLTARPECTRAGTQTWLNKHGFPKTQLICRPTEINHEDGSQWKAETLAKLYPQVLGIIDDNATLLNFLPKDYKGTIFLYDNDSHNSTLNVVPCPTWKDVLDAVKKFVNI